MRISSEGIRFEPVLVPPSHAEARSSSSRAPGQRFSQALEGLGRAMDRGEALVASAARGNLGGLDASELIALQAGIYRYSEAVDLVSKLVERATSAVKTVVSPH
jgi:hypothetical protein